MKELRKKRTRNLERGALSLSLLIRSLQLSLPLPFFFPCGLSYRGLLGSYLWMDLDTQMIFYFILFYFLAFLFLVFDVTGGLWFESSFENSKYPLFFFFFFFFFSSFHFGTSVPFMGWGGVCCYYGSAIFKKKIKIIFYFKNY